MSAVGGGPSAACPFCEIVAGRAPATVLRQWPEALALVPLRPVVPGHVLVIPKMHVTDASDNPAVAATTMWAAAAFARDIGPHNIITSKGREATQSVFHLHLHVVPRADGDGLALPWWSGKPSRANARSGESS